MRPDYTHSIVNITSSLLARYGVEHDHPTLRSLDGWLKKNHEHIVVFLLDGLGESLMRMHLDEEDFLRQHRKDSVTSVFPATTTAATTALLTGKTPLETGFLGWFLYFPKEDIHYEIFTNSDFYDDKKKIPEGFHEKHFQYEDFFTKIKRVDPGMKTAIFHPVPVDDDGHETFAEGIERYKAFKKKHKRTAAYIYSREPDILAHQKGTADPSVRKAIRELNDRIAAFAKDLDEDTLVIVTADHGMVDVEEIPLFDFHDITATFRHLPANEPRMTNFFIREGSHEHFITFFNEHFSHAFELYTKRELLGKGFLGKGTPHPLVEETLGDFIAVAKDRYMFKLSDKVTHKAHHAGMTEDEMRVPLILFDKQGGDAR